MTDPTEQLLRDTLADDASRAPAGRDLADAAAARARAGRRGRLIAGGSALAMAAVVGGAALFAWTRPALVEPLPTELPSPAASPTAAPSGPALEFRGVFVPVPAEMLRPEAVQCGTALTDAAYVVEADMPIETCAIEPDHPERLTEVVLQPILLSIAEGESVMADGRTQLVRYVDERQVLLRVVSPDPERARQLVDGMFVVDAPDGCSVEEPAGPTPRPGPWIDPPLIYPDARVLTVCGYRDGWLTESTTLARGEDAELVAALAAVSPKAAVPAPLPEACIVGSDGSPPGPGFWLVTVDDSGPMQLFVYGERCSLVVADDGRVGSPTDDLVSELWRTASGPFWFTGVEGSK